MDIPEFTRRYTRALVELTAGMINIPGWEAERRYNTDARFHAQIDTLVQTAVQIFLTLGDEEIESKYRSVFEDEVRGLSEPGF